jgi:flagellar export protein FliJ
MTFRFSLQKILELRELETNQAQKQVIETKNKIAQLKKILEEERHLYFSDRDALNQWVLKVNLSEIQIYEKSLALRQSRMMDLLTILREMDVELKERDELFMKAKLNQKIIEKLYQIKEKEYEKMESIKEQQNLDEMANMGFIKNRLELENNEDEFND